MTVVKFPKQYTPALLHTNVLANYRAQLEKAFDSISGARTLVGLSGEASIPVIEQAINRLEDDGHIDQWLPTEGNARRALMMQLELAKLHRDAIWQ